MSNDNRDLPRLPEDECKPKEQSPADQLKQAREQQELQATYPGRKRSYPE